MSAEEARRKFAETLGELKTARKEHGEGLATNQRAIEALTAAVQTVQEAQADDSRARIERSSYAGKDGQLRFYGVAEEAHVRKNPRAYIKNGSGAVRLRGHATHSGRGWRYGLLDDPKPKTEWQHDLQRAVTERAVVRAHLTRHENQPVDSPVSDEIVMSIAASGPEFMSRIFSDSTNIGAEWIPSDLVAELERETQHVRGFSDMFESRPAPSSMVIPYREGNLRPFRSSPPTADDPADYEKTSIVTRQNTVIPLKLAIATQIDRDATEDSIIAVIPELTGDIGRGFAFGRDDIAVNADAAGTHQDAIATWDTRGIWGTVGLGGTNDHRTGQTGLRARAFDISNTTDQNGAQTAAGIAVALKNLGPEYYAGMGLGRLKIAMSPEYLLGTAILFTELETWDGVGAAATILTGLLGGRSGPSPNSVGFIYGVEVVITPFLTADLATSGLFTGSGSTTGMLQFAPDDFEWRVRQGMTMEQAVDIKNDTITVVSRQRMVFRTKADDTSSNRDNVHFSFNLTA